ncbi:MAG: hypothetical protein MJ131_08395 [Lachnospiraceae bacterium]|nr:hypothetical protein [Lachnospiraceae bacterium]
MNEKTKQILTLLAFASLQFTWGFFQNAYGLLVFLGLTATHPGRKLEFYHGAVVSYWSKSYSMSSGMFIFYGHENSSDGRSVIVHEYGHALQSLALGPLFLFIIGIPSVIWAFSPHFIKLRRYGRRTYLDFYPESWANSWGEKWTGDAAPTR